MEFLFFNRGVDVINTYSLIDRTQNGEEDRPVNVQITIKPLDISLRNSEKHSPKYTEQ